MRIIKDFDDYLLNDYNWPKTSHYASNVTSCRRQQYYQWTMAEKSNAPTAGNVLKMKYGNVSEKVFEDFLKYIIENGKTIDGMELISYDTQWKNKYSVPGLKYLITCKLDFVLHFPDEEMAVELKSSFGMGIKQIAQKQEAKKDYLDQIYVYMHFTPFEKFSHPYFGRDNGYRTEFEVEKTDTGLKTIYTTEAGEKRIKLYTYNIDDIIDRLKDVEACVEEKQIPNRDYLIAIKNGEHKENGFQENKIMYKSDWQCKYCDYLDKCWKEEIDKIKVGSNSIAFQRRGPNAED